MKPPKSRVLQKNARIIVSFGRNGKNSWMRLVYILLCFVEFFFLVCVCAEQKPILCHYSVLSFCCTLIIGFVSMRIPFAFMVCARNGAIACLIERSCICSDPLWQFHSCILLYHPRRVFSAMALCYRMREIV